MAAYSTGGVDAAYNGIPGVGRNIASALLVIGAAELDIAGLDCPKLTKCEGRVGVMFVVLFGNDNGPG